MSKISQKYVMNTKDLSYDTPKKKYYLSYNPTRNNFGNKNYHHNKYYDDYEYEDRNQDYKEWNRFIDDDNDDYYYYDDDSDSDCECDCDCCKNGDYYNKSSSKTFIREKNDIKYSPFSNKEIFPGKKIYFEKKNHNGYNSDDTYPTNDTDNMFYSNSNNYMNTAYTIVIDNSNNPNNINSKINNEKNNYNSFYHVNNCHSNNKFNERNNYNKIREFYQEVKSHYYDDENWLENQHSSQSNIKENNHTEIKNYIRKRPKIVNLKEKNQFTQPKLKLNYGNEKVQNNFYIEIKKEKKVDENKNKKPLYEKTYKNEIKNSIKNVENKVSNKIQYLTKKVNSHQHKIICKSQDFVTKDICENPKNQNLSLNKKENPNFQNILNIKNIDSISKTNIQEENHKCKITLTKDNHIYSFSNKKQQIKSDRKICIKTSSPKNKIIYKAGNKRKNRIRINQNKTSNTSKSKTIEALNNRRMNLKISLSKTLKKKCDICQQFVDSHLLKIHYNSHPTEIFNWLYLGTFTNACDIKELRRLKINYILNVAGECKNTNLPKDIKELHFDIKDYENFELYDYFDEANEFINKCRLEGGVLLVHCKYGISRSASFIIAYLIKYMRYPADYAFNFVFQKRNKIKPNEGFMYQLNKYAEYYVGKKN